nr:QWRF motif-containing protein 2-like [Ipomoea batatas]
MVTAVSTTKTPNPKVNYQSPKRQPLSPSEAANGPTRRPKSREVTSRYLSSSSSTISTSTTSSSNSSGSYSSPAYSISARRSQSPAVTRTARPAVTPIQNSASAKRSQSAERRRPATPVRAEMSAATKLLLTTSTKSLSVSFQRESFSLPVSKAKPVNNLSSVRRGTPERRLTVQSSPAKDRIGNAKPSDQQRWPGRLKPGSTFLTRSLDCGNDRAEFGSRGGVPLFHESNQVKIQAKSKDDVKPQRKVNSSLICGTPMCVDIEASDSESISSGSASSGQEGGSISHLIGGLRGKVVPARFWQEANNRILLVPEQSSPVSKNDGYKIMSPSKQIGNKKILNDRPISSPTSRGFSSPLRGGLRSPSPSKALTVSTNSPLRGMPSPTRTRNGSVTTMTNNLSSPPSILSFAAEVRKGKVGENRVADAHELRLLYNRHLQWCFVNARAEVACFVRTETAERNLYNALLATSKLRHSVKSKRTELLLLKQNLKLYSIFKQQVPCLESWDLIDGEHCSSLSAAICALEASTIRLPVVSGARADIQKIKDAICSTVDVMQAMASSICSLLPKVEQANSLVYELSNTAAQEHASLDQCKDLLSKVAAIQVQACGLFLIPVTNAKSNTREVCVFEC